jgi:hypothetical protein
VDYVPWTVADLLPICAVSRAWRAAATRDELWVGLCREALGGQPLLDRILGGRPRPHRGFHAFFIQRRQALASYQPTLRGPKSGSSGGSSSQGQGQGQGQACPSFSHPPPAGFFDDFVWVLELRDGERPEERLLYSCVLEMGHPQARGRLFTSAGASVVGQGIRLGVDVKGRLAPSPPSSLCPSPVPSGAGAVSPPPSEGDDEAEAEAEEAKGEKPAMRRSSSNESTGSGTWGPGLGRQRRRLSSVADEGQESPELVFRLWVYDRQRQRAACFVSTRLVTDRPPGRWQGRHYDGPFSGPNGGPTTLVVLDESHSLRVQPVVDMVRACVRCVRCVHGWGQGANSLFSLSRVQDTNQSTTLTVSISSTHRPPTTAHRWTSSTRESTSWPSAWICSSASARGKTRPPRSRPRLPPMGTGTWAACPCCCRGAAGQEGAAAAGGVNACRGVGSGWCPRRARGSSCMICWRPSCSGAEVGGSS